MQPCSANVHTTPWYTVCLTFCLVHFVFCILIYMSRSGLQEWEFLASHSDIVVCASGTDSASNASEEGVQAAALA